MNNDNIGFAPSYTKIFIISLNRLECFIFYYYINYRSQKLMKTGDSAINSVTLLHYYYIHRGKNIWIYCI